MSSAKIIFSGRVQGVGFRWFVQREAEMLDLTGSVRNLHNGDVEVIVSGSKDRVDSLIEILKKGNRMSRVDDYSIDWEFNASALSTFRIVF